MCGTQDLFISSTNYGICINMQLARFALDDLLYHWNCWINGPHCKNKLRKVMINGSPKSGTTWMRKLIESVPGYTYAGNFRDNLSKYATVVPGDVLHSHQPFSSELERELKKYDIRVIYMLRDPRDRCVSHLFHARRNKNHAFHEELRTMSDRDALMACMGGMPGRVPDNWSLEWLHVSESWLGSNFPFCLVRYEDLLLDTAGQLKMVCDFLEIPVSDGLLDAIVSINSFERKSTSRGVWKTARKPGDEDPAHKLRKGVQGDWQNYFFQDHVTQFKSFAAGKLIDWGYEQDSGWGRNQPV